MAGSITLSLSQQFDSQARPLSGGFLYFFQNRHINAAKRLPGYGADYRASESLTLIARGGFRHSILPMAPSRYDSQIRGAFQSSPMTGCSSSGQARRRCQSFGRCDDSSRDRRYQGEVRTERLPAL